MRTRTKDCLLPRASGVAPPISPWWVALLLCFCIPAGFVNADVDGLTRLTRLQTSYERELAVISTNAATARAQLDRQYTQKLRDYEKTAQRDGDLDSLLKYRGERERFESLNAVENKDLADPAGGDTLERIRKLQVEYRHALKRANRREAEKTLQLTEKHDRALASLQAMLTRAGDLEGALAVKDERDALEQRPEVASARFVMAEQDAGNQQPTAGAEGAAAGGVADGQDVLTTSTPEALREQLKQRFAHLVKLMEDNEMEKACAYVDPDFVTRFGTETVKRVLRGYSPFLLMTRQNGRPINTDQAEIELGSGHALLRPAAWIGDRWQPVGRPIRWLLIEGEWYLDPAPRRGDGTRGATRNRQPAMRLKESP